MRKPFAVALTAVLLLPVILFYCYDDIVALLTQQPEFELSDDPETVTLSYPTSYEAQSTLTLYSSSHIASDEYEEKCLTS